MDETKSMKNLVISGKKEDFMMWQAKFLAYAHFKDFKGVLIGKETFKKDDGTLTPDEVNQIQNLRKNNGQSYSMLHMCVKDSVRFAAIFNAITHDFTEGDANRD
jgi:hypothetical protein